MKMISSECNYKDHIWQIIFFFLEGGGVVIESHHLYFLFYQIWDFQKKIKKSTWTIAGQGSQLE
jgi:hypothetical protein